MNGCAVPHTTLAMVTTGPDFAPAYSFAKIRGVLGAWDLLRSYAHWDRIDVIAHKTLGEVRNMRPRPATSFLYALFRLHEAGRVADNVPVDSVVARPIVEEQNEITLIRPRRLGRGDKCLDFWLIREPNGLYSGMSILGVRTGTLDEWLTFITDDVAEALRPGRMEVSPARTEFEAARHYTAEDFDVVRFGAAAP